MGLLAALTALLTAITRWLELQIILQPERLQNEIDGCEDQITFLRARGDPADQLVADRLLARVARKRGLAATLPAPSATPASGPASADAGRPVHPPGA